MQIFRWRTFQRRICLSKSIVVFLLQAYPYSERFIMCFMQPFVYSVPAYSCTFVEMKYYGISRIYMNMNLEI